ncbi:molybdopterin cofactor-binding domain-containing protein [Kiloniella sp.]|uniref:xanthine dehydrogenase family protein molybdopterin-binding subunit n=1 Tax=Kiloniella sp. TaxID=1938587 RepID=UPI003B028656
MAEITKGLTLSRRRFLLNCGWVAGGVTVLSSCSSILPALPSMNDPELEDAFSWIQILPTGRVLFFSPRMEMGQGAALGLCQVVAEELNLRQSEIECVIPNTDQTPPFKMTVGSDGIASYFKPVAFCAASLQEKLRERAAEKMGLPISQVTDGKSGFVAPDGRVLTYKELVQGDPLIVEAGDPGVLAKGNGGLKKKDEYQAIGESWKDPALESIVTGKSLYSRDVAIPGMLYGQVLHPPAFGAQLESVNVGTARSLPGVVNVVADKDNNFVGVVAEDPVILTKALEVINAAWEIPLNVDQERLSTLLDVERLRSQNSFEHELQSSGDLALGKEKSKHQLAARYDTPFAAHAAIEPRSAVAWIRDDRVEIWCGSQDPFFVKSRVAKAIGRGADDVLVHSHRLGGGFGGRVRCQASEEAALLSLPLGQPVKVQWDRQMEFQNNYLQPPFSHHIDAGVDEAGMISHWEHDFVSAPIITGAVPKSVSWMVDLVAADKGTARGALVPYEIENKRVRYSDIRTAVPIGAWRGLGSAPNCFAIESFIDELATTAGIDPLEFRLRNLPQSSHRLASVLQTVAKMAHWGQPVSPDVGRGMACGVYKGETPVAVVAEIQIDRDEQKIRVTRIWCAQDSGLVINPDQVENQIMGNIVWGCGLALKEKITINDGAVEATNFDGYEILRHADSPDISIKLIRPENTPPTAVGEAAFAPVAPAITNAVFAATKKRIRSLPLDYSLVFPSSDT